MKSQVKIAVPAIETMTAADLTNTAKACGVPVGKSKKVTLANLTSAIKTGKVHFKSYFTLSTNPALPGEPTQRVTHYAATLRTYKSGPGEENTVHITPATAIKGSPMTL